MSLSPYFLFPGTAAAALEQYRATFGGVVTTHSYADLGRTDGPVDAVAHGMLTGPVPVFAADAGEDDEPFTATGLLMSLLGVAGPPTLRAWFDALAEGGTVIDPLEVRPWGDTDGQVRDRFGVTWLIGYEASAVD
ncbi:VOC family protein [Curtobacterium sp. RRHDQ10]|uniref:VOC family protein n=1 Tax=Curtobacterium phyllosphaerae TaxID=3413379 RepID=UPI003BEF8AA2